MAGSLTRRAFLGMSGAGAGLALVPGAAHGVTSTPKRTVRVNAMVVGSHTAGLVAAHELTRAGSSVALASTDPAPDRLPSGVVGGDIVTPESPAASLARRLGLRVTPPATTGSTLEWRSRSPEPLAAGRLSADGLLESRLRALVRRLARMGEEVVGGISTGDANAHIRDRMSVAAWLEGVAPDAETFAGATTLIEAVWGVSATQLSVLSCVLASRAAGSLDHFAQLALHPPGRVVGGREALDAALLRSLPTPRLGGPVRALHDVDGGVLGSTADSEVFPRVVLASEQWAGTRGGGGAEPGAPVVACRYPNPFWRRHGLSGRALLASGPVRLVRPARDADGTWMLGGAIVDRHGDVPERFIEVLTACFGAEAGRPREVVIAAVPPSIASPWGAPPGGLTAPNPPAHDAVVPIRMLPEEGWLGGLDSAVRAGMRAAEGARRRLAGGRP